MPLMYVQSIKARREMMPTGQDVAGLAIAMSEIASMKGCGPDGDESMMVGVYSHATLSVGQGPGFKRKQGQPLSVAWLGALGLERLVADGELYAATDSQVSEAKSARRKLKGFGGRLEGNELWGSWSFVPEFKIERAQRSEAELASYAKELALAESLPEEGLAGKMKVKRAVESKSASGAKKPAA